MNLYHGFYYGGGLLTVLGFLTTVIILLIGAVARLVVKVDNLERQLGPEIDYRAADRNIRSIFNAAERRIRGD